MWKLRELIPVAMEEKGRVLKYDVSLPMPVFYDIVHDLRHRYAASHNLLSSGGPIDGSSVFPSSIVRSCANALWLMVYGSTG